MLRLAKERLLGAWFFFFGGSFFVGHREMKSRSLSLLSFLLPGQTKWKRKREKREDTFLVTMSDAATTVVLSSA